MTDRQLTRINQDFALAYDSNQWILRRRYFSKGEEKWRPLAFVGSTKSHLLTVMRREGVPEDDARKACAPLPEKFLDWWKERTTVEAHSAEYSAVEGREAALTA